jgi:hypothetical protein
MKSKNTGSWKDIFGSEAGMVFVSSSDTARDIRIVKWNDLPVWIKGAYSSDDQMAVLMTMTWAVGSDGETYFAYGPDGQYVATFTKE